MNCQDARESFSLLLEGGITLTERAPLEIHVRECQACRRELEKLQKLQPHESPRPIDWQPRLSLAPVTRALEGLRPADVIVQLRSRLRLLRIPPKVLRVAATGMLLAAALVVVVNRRAELELAVRQWLPPALFAEKSRTTPSALVADEPALPQTNRVPAPPATSPPPMVRAPARTLPVTQPPDDVKSPPRTQGPVVPRRAPATSSVARDARADRSAKPEDGKLRQPEQRSPEAKGRATKAGPSAAVTSSPLRAPEPTAPAPTGARESVDVVGRLSVKNRSGAERDLEALFTRAGGTTLSRQRGPKVTVIEAVVPQPSYDKFTEGLSRIGSWQVEAGRSPLPQLVRVTVRLAE